MMKLSRLLPEGLLNEGTRSQVGIIDRNGKIVKKSDNLENLIKRVEWTRLKLVK